MYSSSMETCSKRSSNQCSSLSWCHSHASHTDKWIHPHMWENKVNIIRTAKVHVAGYSLHEWISHTPWRIPSRIETWAMYISCFLWMKILQSISQSARSRDTTNATGCYLVWLLPHRIFRGPWRAFHALYLNCGFVVTLFPLLGHLTRCVSGPWKKCSVNW